MTITTLQSKQAVRTARHQNQNSLLVKRQNDKYLLLLLCIYNAPVICVSGPLGAGDTRDKAGLRCRDLPADASRQCRRCAGVLIAKIADTV